MPRPLNPLILNPVGEDCVEDFRPHPVLGFKYYNLKTGIFRSRAYWLARKVLHGGLLEDFPKKSPPRNVRKVLHDILFPWRF